MAEVTADETCLAEVMSLLQAEPLTPSTPMAAFGVLGAIADIPSLREQLAVLVSTGKAKEAIGVQLTPTLR